MSTPRGAAGASFHAVTGFSVQPEDIVCQCGAQLAYLLRPAHNEPAVNGLETLAAVSGTSRAGVCECECHYGSVFECGKSWLRLQGHSFKLEMRRQGFAERVWLLELMFLEMR